MTALLGIDIGTTRARIALASRSGAHYVVRDVATRVIPSEASRDGDIVEPELIATVLEDALRDLDTRVRECVLGVGPPVASLRTMTFPRMGAAERSRAARIDVERRLGRSASDIVVRAHAHDRSGSCAVGAVAAVALRSRVLSAKQAGLSPRAVDFEGAAILRVFPHVDAVLDVGMRRMVLYAHRNGDPLTAWSPVGGAAVTAAIVAELAIDERIAERRKCSIGTAGAGEDALRQLVREAVELIRGARRNHTAIERIAICGNGSRVPGFRAGVQAEAEVAAPMLAPFGLGDVYPDDVATNSADDWALAIGLARWAER